MNKPDWPAPDGMHWHQSPWRKPPIKFWSQLPDHRYALLAGPISQAPEGWLAFRGFYLTREAACEAAATWRAVGCWWQVVDLETGAVVASGRDGV